MKVRITYIICNVIIINRINEKKLFFRTKKKVPMAIKARGGGGKGLSRGTFLCFPLDRILLKSKILKEDFFVYRQNMIFGRMVS